MARLRYFIEVHYKRRSTEPSYFVYDALEERDAAYARAELQRREAQGLKGVIVILRGESIPAELIERISKFERTVGATVRDVSDY